MLVVGEKINASLKAVKEAVANKDAASIRNLARSQAEGGANYIDINNGTFINRGKELMTWLAKEVQKKLDLPLCIDSPDPKAVEAGLKAHRNGQPMINSISGKKTAITPFSLWLTSTTQKLSFCAWMMKWGFPRMPHPL